MRHTLNVGEENENALDTALFVVDVVVSGGKLKKEKLTNLTYTSSYTHA